ncbi:hypothetical protein MRB53_040619 [Persea americana]|nr:hypothetical protein MRB53_040619 [Persea americana]
MLRPCIFGQTLGSPCPCRQCRRPLIVQNAITDAGITLDDTSSMQLPLARKVPRTSVFVVLKVVIQSPNEGGVSSYFWTTIDRSMFDSFPNSAAICAWQITLMLCRAKTS